MYITRYSHISENLKSVYPTDHDVRFWENFSLALRDKLSDSVSLFMHFVFSLKFNIQLLLKILMSVTYEYFRICVENS